MDMNRIHDHCTSFAVSAMLTAAVFSAAPDGLIAASASPLGASRALESAFTAARAQGWSVPSAPAAFGQAPATMPASAAAPEPGRILSEAQFAKIRARFATIESTPMGQKLSTALGFPPDPANPILFRTLLTTNPNAPRHIIMECSYDPSIIIFALRTADMITDYRALKVGDADFKLVLGTKWPKNGEISALTAEEAQAGLNAELAFWAAFPL